MYAIEVNNPAESRRRNSSDLRPGDRVESLLAENPHDAVNKIRIFRCGSYHPYPLQVVKNTMTKTENYQKQPIVSTHERGCWIAFSRIPTLGAVQLLRLYTHFGSMSAAWEANTDELRRAALLPATLQAIIATRPSLSPSQEFERVTSAGISTLCISEPTYPQLLKEIYDPPPLLYFRGVLPQSHDLLIAVVGTRKATSYGIEATHSMVSDLCSRNICIVSGLAHGIDTIAHTSALEANGRTLAVLGSSVDCIYPSSNERLARAIVDAGGALVSEYPLGTTAQKHHFPLRNRIIAGISYGVLVVEGDADSGSLITARCALECGREVMAVPGDIFRPGSKGPNSLIAMGAQPVMSAEDIFHAVHIVPGEKNRKAVDNPSRIGNNQQSIQLNADERAIMELLARESLHVDEIVKNSTLPTSAVNATLAILEVRGLVKNLGGMRYARTA